MISLMLSVGGGGRGKKLPQLLFPPHTNAHAHGNFMGVVLPQQRNSNLRFKITPLGVISTPNFYSKSGLEMTPRWEFI